MTAVRRRSSSIETDGLVHQIRELLQRRGHTSSSAWIVAKSTESNTSLERSSRCQRRRRSTFCSSSSSSARVNFSLRISLRKLGETLPALRHDLHPLGTPGLVVQVADSCRCGLVDRASPRPCPRSSVCPMRTIVSPNAESGVVESRWRTAGLVVLSVMGAFALGVLARLWMRLIAVQPEFTWGGTLGIVIGFTVFGLTGSLAALARRRRWRPWAARVARCAGIIGMLPLFVAAGGQMMPTVVFGGLAAWRTDWPTIARAACVPFAAISVLFVGSGIVDDFGWSLHSLAGFVGLLGLYGVIVRATRPTMSRPANGWPVRRVAAVAGIGLGAVVVVKIMMSVV